MIVFTRQNRFGIKVPVGDHMQFSFINLRRTTKKRSILPARHLSGMRRRNVNNPNCLGRLVSVFVVIWGNF